MLETPLTTLKAYLVLTFFTTPPPLTAAVFGKIYFLLDSGVDLDCQMSIARALGVIACHPSEGPT